MSANHYHIAQHVEQPANGGASGIYVVDTFDDAIIAGPFPDLVAAADDARRRNNISQALALGILGVNREDAA
jgi:hypothetical protein